MNDEHRDALPPGWAWVNLSDIALINPKTSWDENIHAAELVTFVPMASVDDELGAIVAPKLKPLGEVSKGYTRFAENDVLFAKITPCMENGKAAIAAQLKFGIGFGSTEFHVLRPTEVVIPKWLYHFIRQQHFRDQASRIMTGSAGQLRVPTRFFEQITIPLAPLAEQQRIVAALESAFTRLDAGVAALKRLRAHLKRYKAAVLKAAAEGQLVPQDPADEPADDLLRRILRERRQHWEAEQRAKGRDPRKLKYDEPAAPATADLPNLPPGWVWASLDTLLDTLQYGTSVKADATPENGIPVLRMGNIQDGKLHFDNLKYISPEQEDIEKYQLLPKDLLINRTNSPELVGKTAIFQSDELFIFASYLIRLRVNPNWSLPEFVAHVINSPWGQSYIAQVRHQVAGQANINSQNIREFPMPLPPLSEQQRILTQIEQCFSIIDEMRYMVNTTLQRAERLRQAILREAFAGRLVPQDPADEPAPALLKRLQRERAQPDNRTRKERR